MIEGDPFGKNQLKRNKTRFLACFHLFKALVIHFAQRLLKTQMVAI